MNYLNNNVDVGIMEMMCLDEAVKVATWSISNYGVDHLKEKVENKGV